MGMSLDFMVFLRVEGLEFWVKLYFWWNDCSSLNAFFSSLETFCLFSIIFCQSWSKNDVPYFSHCKSALLSRAKKPKSYIHNIYPEFSSRRFDGSFMRKKAPMSRGKFRCD